jgi:hypothetical protein
MYIREFGVVSVLPTNVCSIPGKGEFFHPSICPGRLPRPRGPLSKLVEKLRLNGSILLLPTMPSWFAQEHLYFRYIIKV